LAQSILICEDDATLAAILRRLLRERRHCVSVVSEGQLAVEAVEREPPDLLLLDLMLPDMDGLDVCRQLRGKFTGPIIIMSGRAAEIDRVVGLEIGADAYLVKPFAPSELMARAAALLRRAGRNAEVVQLSPVMQIGHLCLDLEGRQLLRGGEEVHLTPKEFDLFAALAAHLGQVVRSERLLLQVWGYDQSIRTRTLDVHIGRLRAKIEQDTSRPQYLLTVPGVGYRLRAPEDRSAAA
jgi:DNA-binding response OmpR family regulator